MDQKRHQLKQLKERMVCTFSLCLGWFIAIQALTSVGLSQTPEASRDLIVQLRSQEGLLPFVGTCGAILRHQQMQRDTARALVAQGEAAVPEIERALASATQGNSGVAGNSGSIRWLLSAYATLMGSRAYPRLRALLEDRQAVGIRSHILDALAVGLNLTAYVASSSIPQRSLCGSPNPRDALSGLLFAWETGDTELLSIKVGPKAAAALAASRIAPSVLRMKNKAASGLLAVGFKFNNAGPWSTPIYALNAPDSEAPRLSSDLRIHIETSFATQGGTKCGDLRLEFALTSSLQGPMYMVDTEHIVELLQTVAGCANHTTTE
jgi:hypothetical protein